MSRVFISHSAKNNAEALALRDWLDENGWGREEVFLDIDPTRGLVAGERWQARLKEASHRCEAVLFVISPAWVASRWCGAEFLLAKTLGKKVFGVMVESTPWEVLPPELTAEFQVVNLAAAGPRRDIEVKVPPDDTSVSVCFNANELQRLKAGLDKAGIDARSFPFDPARPIFRGLRALEERDAAIFFGREGKIVEALDALRSLVHRGASKLLVILGASGAGKSSFLRAGLYPRLERDDRIFLALPVVRPEHAAMRGEHGLIAALAQSAKTLDIKLTRASIEAALTEPNGLSSILRTLQQAAHARLIDDAAGLPFVVLSIDQGEELFDADSGAESAELLRHVLPVVNGPLIVLLCMRSDNFERLQHAPGLLEHGVDLTVFSLSPLPVGAFKEVIEGPVRRLREARGQGAAILDPRLTDQILADLGGESADALPLLAFLLERLLLRYERLTLGDYQASGGLQGVIAGAVAEALRNPKGEPAIPDKAEQQETLLRGAFIPHLVRIDGDSGEVRRRVAPFAALPADTVPLVERLVNARLLVKHGGADRGAPGAAQIEVAHEALLRQWPSLRLWIEQERDLLRIRSNVSRAFSSWKAAATSERSEFVLRGPMLMRAVALLKDRGSWLHADEIDFIRRSRTEAVRNRAITAVPVVGGVIVLAVAAMWLAFDAYVQRSASACDHLAVEPVNDVFLPGVELDSIDAAQAVPACVDAVKLDPANPRLMHNLARAWERAGDHSEAAAWYERAIRLSWPASTNNLGVLYLHGWGVEPSMVRAVELFRTAIRGGDANAKRNYAVIDFAVIFQEDEPSTRVFQDALVARQLLSSRDANGKWGPATLQAVAQFRARAGLSDGSVTLEVMDKLEILKALDDIAKSRGTSR